MNKSELKVQTAMFEVLDILESTLQAQKIAKAQIELRNRLAVKEQLRN